MNTLKTIWEGLDWSQLTDILLRVLPSLFCITIHELSHGLVARFLGDNTAEQRGRLSLNPLRHIDPLGLLMMVLFKFGWAKPVPVNMYNFKHPKRGMAITALAGPVSNLILSAFVLFLFGFVYRFLSGNNIGEIVLEFLYLTAYISLGLAIFNFIPMPPLDGSKILFALLPDNFYYKLMRIEKYGALVLFILASTGFFSSVLSGVISYIFNGYFKIAQWAFLLAKDL